MAVQNTGITGLRVWGFCIAKAGLGTEGSRDKTILGDMPLEVLDSCLGFRVSGLKLGHMPANDQISVDECVVFVAFLADARNGHIEHLLNVAVPVNPYALILQPSPQLAPVCVDCI